MIRTVIVMIHILIVYHGRDSDIVVIHILIVYHGQDSDSYDTYIDSISWSGQ